MKPFKKSPLNLNPGKNAHLPRNSFDMSYHSVFNSPAGLLLPAYVQDVQPGDFLKLDVSNFTRTMPVNTAAFSRLKEVTDFYFVPYRLLWRRFNQFYTGVNDTDTSYIPDASNIPSSIPKLDLTNLIGILNPDDVTVDIKGVRNIYTAERLLDLLGYPVSNDSSVSTYTFLNHWKTNLTAAGKTFPSFSPMRLLAYQKIFMDFYRNSDYTTSDAEAYNVDNTQGGQTPQYWAKFFTPRYVQWKKDRFTSVKPSPLATFSNPSSSIIPQFGEGMMDNQGGGYASRSSTYSALLSNVPSVPYNAQVNISQLRATMAYDRLARLTMLTPKTYEAQLKSQFGVEPDNCDYCSVRYLGSYDSNLNIGEVTATGTGETTSGSKSVLGQLAGKGISAGQKNGVIKASFNEPGIVMGLHYFQPFSEYDSNRVDNFVRKLNRNDYYMPNYDNLGLQPILTSDLSLNSVSPPVDYASVTGYQARYLEYKTRTDEVHGQFQSGQPLSSWCMPRSAVVSASGIIASGDFYVSPYITNSLFALSYDGTQPSDPFMCHFKFDATLVRNMSVLGIPSM